MMSFEKPCLMMSNPQMPITLQKDCFKYSSRCSRVVGDIQERLASTEGIIRQKPAPMRLHAGALREYRATRTLRLRFSVQMSLDPYQENTNATQLPFKIVTGLSRQKVEVSILMG